jgi:hypothetical protein
MAAPAGDTVQQQDLQSVDESFPLRIRLCACPHLDKRGSFNIRRHMMLIGMKERVSAALRKLVDSYGASGKQPLGESVAAGNGALVGIGPDIRGARSRAPFADEHTLPRKQCMVKAAHCG